MVKRALGAAVLALAVCAAAGCRNRTYVLVAVEVEDGVQGPIERLRFVSELTGADGVAQSDEQEVTGSNLTLPDSFIVLADDRGGDSESVDVFVEAFRGDGTLAARARGSAPILRNNEAVLQLTLRPGCQAMDDCLAGRAFCDALSECNCAGQDCNRGFCQAVAGDDDNPCTVSDCNEAEQVITHNAVEDGMACENDDGEMVQCARGICKSPNCGDFIVDRGGGEECDEGPFGNSDVEPLACRTNCMLPSCGDGVADVGLAFGRNYTEQCDDGADNHPLIADTDVAIDGAATPDDRCRQVVTLDNGTGAVVECRLPFCGDGVLNGSERCDDHNTDDSNGSASVEGCNPTCTMFGEVSTLAGSPGGPGFVDGVGTDARLHDIRGLVAGGGFAYFTANQDDTVFATDHAIRRVDLSDGSVVTLAGGALSGHADGVGADALFNGPNGLALDGTSLYIADTQNQRIKRLDLTTNQVTTVAGTGAAGTNDGTLATARFSRPLFVAVRSPTVLLVMEITAPATCRLRQVDLAGDAVTTLIGGFCLPGQATLFSTEVLGMVMGPDPLLYVADGNKIREVDVTPGSVTITDVAGASTAGLVNETGTAARFDLPSGMAIDGGNLYIADQGNDVLRKMVLADKVVTTETDADLEGLRAVAVDGSVAVLGDRKTHTVWTASLLDSTPLPLTPLAGIPSHPDDETVVKPSAIAALASVPGHVFVVQEKASQPVLGIATATGTINDYPGLFDGTTLLGGTFGAAGDGSRLLVVEDKGVHTIEFDTAGVVTSGPVGFDLDAQVVQELLLRSVSIVGDDAYLTDFRGGLVWKVAAADMSGFTPYAGDVQDEAVIDGPPALARFIAPAGGVTCGGRVYASEVTGIRGGALEGQVIRELDPVANTVTTIAGRATSAGFADGVGLDALFSDPKGLACDDRDSDNPILYVADTNNSTIRQIVLATGEVSTLAGDPNRAASRDGQGNAAGFGGPRGIVFDPASGNLFVTDDNEGLVRVIR